MKIDKVGSFTWFTKMNEAKDEQKETKFFNSKDRYKISLKCEHEKTDKRSSAPSRRYEVNEKGLTLAQVVSTLKKNDKPGTMKSPGISVNSYTITNETTGKTYTHSERSGKGLYDKGLSNITVSDLKSINESDEFEDEDEFGDDLKGMEDFEGGEAPETDDVIIGEVSKGEIAIDWATELLKEINQAFPNEDYINKLSFKDGELLLSVLVEEKWADFSLTPGQDGEKEISEIIEEIKKDLEEGTPDGEEADPEE